MMPFNVNPSNGTPVHNSSIEAGHMYLILPTNAVIYQAVSGMMSSPFKRQVHSRQAYSPQARPTAWIGGWDNPRRVPGAFRRGIRPVSDSLGAGYSVFSSGLV